MDIRLGFDGQVHLTRRKGPGVVDVVAEDGTEYRVEVQRLPGGAFTTQAGGALHPAEGARDGETIWVRYRGRTYRFTLERGRRSRRARPAGDLSSPMPGQVQKVLVAEGDTVEIDQPLLVVEAMKMQLEIRAPRTGTVSRLLAREGDQVEAGAPLAEVREP